ncbi:uncharacterized protein LOC133181764 [Saccostrea echinata]|uniref:uncharacterized protein LOC133181764 n=1 Tax=Saccostrea echinata TaxID=191078 RepID=UPI002A8014FE|nr:uncharacterized protein LOC133181764 [Saccostrea echinata]
MDVFSAIEGFRNISSGLKGETSLEFLKWVKDNVDDLIEKQIKSSQSNSEVVLQSIREDLRSLLPLNGVTPTENIYTPTVGPNADCDRLSTEHIDAFCYDDDDIDDLCDEGQMSRNYCTDCGSRNVRPLTLITHSASVKQIKYMFQHLLGDLRGKTVVDVGSRTGAILYGAYLMSNASCIVGVEIDQTFCHIQNQIISKYHLQDRVQIHQQDVQQCGNLIQQADVLILNNVFEFFMPLDMQKSIWHFLYQNMRKKGSYIVTVPSITESLQTIQLPLDLGSWIQEIPTGEITGKANLLLYGNQDSEDSELLQIHLYQVV